MGASDRRGADTTEVRSSRAICINIATPADIVLCSITAHSAGVEPLSRDARRIDRRSRYNPGN